MRISFSVFYTSQSNERCHLFVSNYRQLLKVWIALRLTSCTCIQINPEFNSMWVS